MHRRYLAEVLGTFAIVVAPVALSATGNLTNGASGLLAAALISGLVVMALIYSMGPISAAHFNPAVTIAFALTRRFPWRFAPAYIAAQVFGATLAAAVVTVLFGAGHGTHVPSGSLVQALGTEVLLAFLLMLVITAVATDKRVSSAVPAIAIGATVTVCVLIGGPVSGGSMNPARSLGPALVSGGDALKSAWVYLIGPVVGACLGALAFELVRIEHAAAVGAPNELSEAIEEVNAERS